MELTMHRESQLTWWAVVTPALPPAGWHVDLFAKEPGRIGAVEHVAGPSTRTLFGARRVARGLLRRQAFDRRHRGRVLVDRV